MSDVVGVALVGCAHTTHAWSYARALTSSVETRLVGVYEEQPELARQICADFSAPVVDDAMDLVSSPEVDAVVVCSSTAQHRTMVELSASRGKHVLCEKPIATTREDAQAMIATCASAGVQLHVAFVSRFHPLVEKMRAAVRLGELGELVGMVGGNRGRPPLPPDYPEWITSAKEAGGGALIDHSVHVTDVMRHVSGQEVTRVSAEVGAQLWDCGVDDVALMSLVFDRGLVASVDPSWSVPEGNPWDYDFFLRVVGTRGSMDISDLAESLHLVSASLGNRLRLAHFGVDLDQRLVEAFGGSVRSGKVCYPCATGEDGLRALDVALAGYASGASASPTFLPPA